ncbi:MAG: LarC family nickel insertion protein, partial [Eggerthellales bacterium]|nr:LarC family nickel insertion protein [Eggerthellales bacterium]
RQCVVERLCEGRGAVRCQHGLLPVPVPAVSNIVAKAGIPVSIVDVQGELVTPTGAAAVAAIRTLPRLPERFLVKKVGMGAGKRTYQVPNILRAMLIEPLDDLPVEVPAADGVESPAADGVESPAADGVESPAADSSAGSGNPAVSDPYIWKLETEVDDCSGEQLGFTLECLLAAGAKEAHFIPVFTKKNRPANQIQVLCTQADIPVMEEILFTQTTTIGIRHTPMERSVLPRTIAWVETPYGPARIKSVTLPDGTLRHYPEYEDVAALCRTSGIGYHEVYQAVLASAAPSGRYHGAASCHDQNQSCHDQNR